MNAEAAGSAHAHERIAGLGAIGMPATVIARLAPAVVGAYDQAAAALHVDTRRAARTIEVIAARIGARAVTEFFAALAAHARRAIEITATREADADRIRRVVIVVAAGCAGQREANDDEVRGRSKVWAELHLDNVPRARPRGESFFARSPRAVIKVRL